MQLLVQWAVAEQVTHALATYTTVCNSNSCGHCGWGFTYGSNYNQSLRVIVLWCLLIGLQKTWKLEDSSTRALCHSTCVLNSLLLQQLGARNILRKTIKFQHSSIKQKKQRNKVHHPGSVEGIREAILSKCAMLLQCSINICILYTVKMHGTDISST